MIPRIPTKGHKQASTSQGEPNASNEESSFKLFSDSDIMNATNNLSEESTIGKGGFGNVYKGTIVNAEVAIKILDTKGTQGANEFIQEMAVLKNLKHENLVKLMGACLEIRALVYEYLPRGSLEDCLNNSPRLLTWQIRIRIVYEICSVLMFLHSMKPKPLVHGDLKPQNILLDADLHCRLSDFGLCRFLPEFSENTGAYLQTKSINGTDCYIDPDYLEFGKLTPGCDVYSFGVTILRILTGQPPFRICKKVRRASRSNSLMTIVDSTAGDWPVEVAEYLAKSGVGCCKDNRNNLKLMTELSTYLENLAEKGCCEMSRKSQPDIVGKVSRVLEPMMKANSSSVSTVSSGSVNENNSPIPSDFVSQILQGNQEILIRCISQDLGFSNGRPIAACVIYKCLLHWRSFEVERTSVFDRIIQVIGSSLETQDENDVLSYWLSNSSTLSLLLQQTLKASGAASLTPQLRASPRSAGLNDFRQTEAKHPALLFKQQLIAYLEKIYGMIRDNMKKEISPLLALCIQAPRTSRVSLVKGSRSQVNAMAQQALIAHWQIMVKSLNNYLETLRANFVPPFLVRMAFAQIFSFINVQLFNSLLLRRECCSFSNGEYIKAGLAELELWCFDATEEYSGSSWDELKHIQQAVGFLVIHQKPKKTLQEITNDLCPVLSVQQLYRMSTMYWDDKYGTSTVSSDVISGMRVLMTEDFSNNVVSSSFLLDDDSSIRFSMEDIYKSMGQIGVADVDPPGFSFLLQPAD
ncbi:myosin-17-like [Iris pallida]|uniref:RING-type E3 ubiquitin transferase n=1 Tax=Iris pallida TaxID=29817 RepID=A0AAX6H827_IRIPA|nr:myosin-17-like [Iris pallida]